MSEGLQPFAFDGRAVRVVIVDGEPWFVAKDVAEVLGYADGTTAVRSHCRGVQKLHPIVDSLGRTQEARVISRPDVYRLIAGSTLPDAERFERWIFEEVLPSIHSTGSYSSPQTLEQRALAVVTELKALCDQQAAQLAVAAPKAEFVDRFVEATGRYTMQDAGRVLGVGANRFCNWLVGHDYVFRDSMGRLTPRSQHLDAGIFEVKAGTYKAGEQERAYKQTYVTAKGLEHFGERINGEKALVMS